MTSNRFEAIQNGSLAEQRPARQFFLRYSVLTVASFVPLIWAFLTSTEWYPVSDFKMFSQNGSVVGGSRALVEVLEAMGYRLLAAVLESLPFRPFTWIGYRLVAANRDLISAKIGRSCAVYG